MKLYSIFGTYKLVLPGNVCMLAQRLKREAADKDTCIYIKNWFKGQKYQHLTFITEDHTAFRVLGERNKITKSPFMLDYSMSTKGVTCDLKSKEVIETLSGVQTIVDSLYPDRMTGNDAANFISSKGKDFIQGNGGNDAYKLSKNCKDTVINNYDIHLDEDIIFIDQDYSDLTLNIEPTEQSLEIYVTDLGKVATLLKWFKDKTFQHASLRTADGVTAILPELASKIESDNKPIAAEFSLENENCNYGRKMYNLSETKFQKVSRFTAKSKLCRYNVQGNKLNNYLDPGPGNPYGYQYLEGGDGADTYVIGADYGEFNEINNFAEDLHVDFVMFGVVYKDIEVDIDQDAEDMIVKTKVNYKNSAVGVRIKNFLVNAKYQHIVFQSVDKITFKLVTHYPHKKPMIVDYSHLKFNQILNANSLFESAGVIYGSSKKQNKISGSSLSDKLTGGSESDIIEGGSGGEQIEGFGGNDILKGNLGDDIMFGGDGDDDISGGEGNDVIDGGFGADKIDGGAGMDAIVLAGDGIKKEGVKVSLKQGKGEGGDAQGDTYKSVEIVHGSDFNDIIEGNNDNNILSGNGGQDTLVTYEGYDVLTGGLESDTYDLTNGEGWKVINNFASDSVEDNILVGNLAKHPCIYSYDNDLYIHLQKKNQKFLNLIIKEWYTEGTFQHLQLNYKSKNGIQTKHSYAKRTRRGTSVDKWVSFFNTNAKLEVNAHDFESITVQVDDIIKYIPIDSYELYLNYVSENKRYRKIKLSNKLSQGPPSFKLRGNILSGVMVSIMISLHICNQVIAMTSPVNQRSLPTAPTNVRLVKKSSTTLSVSWDIPSKVTNPNRHHYQYKCIAITKSATPKKVFESLSAKGAATFLFNRLQPDTQYILQVYSVIGGEKSENPLEISTRTLNICTNLKGPENGNIIEEKIENGIKYAVVTCMDGYELAAVNKKDSNTKKISTEIRVECNFTEPCVQWNGGACVEVAGCIPTECSKVELSKHHLSIESVDRNILKEGDEIRVSCDHGYEFENHVDFMYVQCRGGKWHPRSGGIIPKCLRYFECRAQPTKNMKLLGDDIRRNSAGKFIVKHGSFVSLSCDEGYELYGPDELTCKNGTINPSIHSSCSPIPCHEIRSPDNGLAKLSPSKYPIQDSIYTFTCKKSYWLSGADHTVCKTGSWTVTSPPHCVPMPCNSSPCINGATCNNMKSVKGYNYQCQCTRDWHGDTCEHRTVHKATLTKEIEKFVKSSGGACKTDELYDYLAGNIRGRYPSYKWTVLCQVKRGRMDSYVETDSQIINYESSSHQTWILWENRNLPSSTVSRYSRGKAKAEQYLKNMDIKICYPKILMDLIRKEFKKMNLSYLMITVMRGDRREGVAFAYRGRSEMVSESGVRRAILCIEGAVFNDFHRIIHVLVIGAQEKA